MKQRTFLFIFLLLSTLTASAYNAKINGIFYYLDTSAKTATVTAGSSGYMGSVTIPATITYNGVTYSVTEIGDDAFYECSSLTEVTIPSSVTVIGSSAFAHCSNLISINLPNSVTEIGSTAFYECSSLTSVTIPNSVIYIMEGTFRRCSGLTSVTIGNGVTQIRNYAFSDCIELKSLTIGSGVKKIYGSAFDSCPSLTHVYCYAENVPSTVSSAFDGSYIEYVTLYVPEGSVAAYKAAAPWSGFGTIKTLSGETPVTPKCATPTIAYVDGKLKFSCETVGVEYVSTITPHSAYNGNSDEVSLKTTYKVTVYATKDGYENSDVATKDIEVGGGGESSLRGDVNEDGEVNVGDLVTVSNIMAGNE